MATKPNTTEFRVSFLYKCLKDRDILVGININFCLDRNMTDMYIYFNYHLIDCNDL